MTQTTEAMKSALCVLCAAEKANDWHPNMVKDFAFAIEALRAALSSQPPAPRAPLSEEQIEAALDEAGVGHHRGEDIVRRRWWLTRGSVSVVKFARAIERASLTATAGSTP